MSAPVVHLLTDGGAGMTAQASGLATQIAALGGCEIRQTVVAPTVVNLLPPALASLLQFNSGGGGEHADIVIVCGARARTAALMMKKKWSAFAVCIQRPRGSEKYFDAVVAPHHDYSEAEIRTIENAPDGKIVLTLGSVGTINRAVLLAAESRAKQKFAHISAPKTAILIGGDSRAYRMSPQFCRELTESVRRADPSGGVLATVSRRTGDENTRMMAASFAGGDDFFHDGNGENPYTDILAAADRFVVSGDSVNMLSEACATAKPVWIAALPQKSARAAGKFRRFHDALVARHLARRWAGAFAEWTPPGLDETARAADFVWRRYCQLRDSPVAAGR